MATSETGFSDIVHDLISVQYHALKGCREYEQYARDADEEAQPEIADFFRNVLRQDAERAVACHRYLSQLAGRSPAGSIGH